MAQSDIDWLYGIVMNVVGSLFINFSATSLKYAHNMEMRDAGVPGLAPEACGCEGNACLRRVLTSRLVVVGTSHVLFVVGNLLNFVSFGFAAQSMLSALGSIQFVSNVFLARWLLGEVVTKWTLVGTAIIIVGDVLIVAFGTKTDLERTVAELRSVFRGNAYQTYMGVAAGVLVLLLCLCAWLRKKYNIEITTPVPEPVVFPRYSSDAKTGSRYPLYGTGGNGWSLSSFFLQPAAPSSTVVRLYAVCYVLISGIVGTQAVTYAKALSTIARSVFRGYVSWMETPFTYQILAVWVVCMAFWLWRRSKVLQVHDTLFIVPVLQVVWIALSVLEGGIYFAEFSGYSPVQAAMFSLGMTLLFVGVGVMTRGQHDATDGTLAQRAEETSLLNTRNSEPVAYPNRLRDSLSLALGLSVPMSYAR